MPILNIKPLSVNEAWQGKRFKTPAYKKYEKIVLLMMPKINILNPPYRVNLEFGFSSPLADIDNPTKLILDIIQKKYNINDKDIFELNIRKKIVKKGNEYIDFQIVFI
jgi:Holliday junction resolvase RusA-like endonuclease